MASVTDRAAVRLVPRVSGAMRVYATDGHGPAQVLTGLNRLLDRALALAIPGATLISLDVASEDIEAASAVHPYALLCGPDGGARFLNRAQGDARR